MKLLLNIIVLSVCICFAASAEIAFFEYFENGAEAPPYAWYTSDLDSCFFIADDGYQSDHSLGIMYPNSYHSNAVSLDTPNIGIQPETDYTVCFYYKTEEVGMSGIDVTSHYISTDDENYDFSIEENETWTAATYNYTSGLMYCNSEIQFYVWEFIGTNGYAVLYIDDVKIEGIDKVYIKNTSLGKIKSAYK